MGYKAKIQPRLNCLYITLGENHYNVKGRGNSVPPIIGNSVPPMLNFPRKKCPDILLKGAPPGTIAHGSEMASGWMCNELFLV